jgi:predicted phage gp36 major capsid-like protein
MKKDYVVKSIDAAPDGAPYVIVSLTSSKELKEGTGQSTMSPKVMGFTNMNDMMKDLNKMLGGMGGMQGGATSIKLDMHEYKQMSLSVGDKVFLELTKAESLGV